MKMRSAAVAIVAGFSLATSGCPKEKERKCNPIPITLDAGGFAYAPVDACASSGPDPWPSDLDTRLRISGLPWFLTSEIKVLSPWYSTMGIFFTANAHAPRGLVTASYTYQLNVGVTNDVIITVELPESQHQLAVAVTGGGMVSNTELQCREGSDRCAASYHESETLVLDLQPDAGFEVDSVTGCGSLTSDGAQLTGNLTADVESCTVTFRRQANKRVLDLSVTGGGGEVLVESGASSETCTGECAMAFDAGAQVSLTAREVGDFVFVGWAGGCEPSGLSASVTLDTDTTCVAQFYNSNATYHTLTVTIEGADRSNSYVSIPGMASCAASSCTYQILADQPIALTAYPDREAYYAVVRWTDDCAAGPVDSVTIPRMDSSKTCGVVLEYIGNGLDCTNPQPPEAGRIELRDSTDSLITTTRTVDLGGGIGSVEVYMLSNTGIVRGTAAGFRSRVGGVLVYSWDGAWSGTGDPNPTYLFQEYTFDTFNLFPGSIYGLLLRATDGCGGVADVEIFYEIQ
jgi:hypothetical protein